MHYYFPLILSIKEKREKEKDFEIRALYPDGLTAFTENTVTDMDYLFYELELTRNRGYAIEREESTPLVNCVGIPLCSNGRIIAALSVCIPTFRFSEEKLQFIIGLLKDSKVKLEEYFQVCDVDLGSIC